MWPGGVMWYHVNGSVVTGVIWLVSLDWCHVTGIVWLVSCDRCHVTGVMWLVVSCDRCHVVCCRVGVSSLPSSPLHSAGRPNLTAMENGVPHPSHVPPQPKVDVSQTSRLKGEERLLSRLTAHLVLGSLVLLCNHWFLKFQFCRIRWILLVLFSLLHITLCESAKIVKLWYHVPQPGVQHDIMLYMITCWTLRVGYNMYPGVGYHTVCQLIWTNWNKNFEHKILFALMLHLPWHQSSSG